MPTYVHLVNYTQKGIDNIGENEPQPGDVMESIGAGELKAMYLTFGQYDLVAVTEFPDDETAAQFLVRMAQGGHSTSETLRAFPEDEMAEIFAGLGD